MSIIRVEKRDRFLVVDKALLEDESLSFKAKGLAVYLLSKPDGWTANSRQLMKAGPDGQAAVLSGLKELEEAKYLVRKSEHNPDGTWTYISVLHEVPLSAEEQAAPCVGFPDAVFPDAENPRISTEEGSSDVCSNEETKTIVELPLNDVDLVFEAWKVSTNRRKSVLDAKRKGLIEKALKNYTPEDLCLAVTGWKNSPWHRGENDNGKIYNDLELILRNAGKIEDFLAWANAPPKGLNGKRDRGTVSDWNGEQDLTASRDRRELGYG